MFAILQSLALMERAYGTGLEDRNDRLQQGLCPDVRQASPLETVLGGRLLAILNPAAMRAREPSACDALHRGQHSRLSWRAQ